MVRCWCYITITLQAVQEPAAVVASAAATAAAADAAAAAADAPVRAFDNTLIYHCYCRYKARRTLTHIKYYSR